ncbi:MAG: hypothetical protein PHF57_12475 [Methanoregula sp.]|jgi:post-segregation antitoxin (ccd killing protein)|nr:hypothetical protein [Methanoregula sp.]
MGTITIGKDGVEFIHTNVIVPRYLRDFAKDQDISMSRELRVALETKMKEGNTGRHAATRPQPPAVPSSTAEQVDV